MDFADRVNVNLEQVLAENNKISVFSRFERTDTILFGGCSDDHAGSSASLRDPIDVGFTSACSAW